MKNKYKIMLISMLSLLVVTTATACESSKNPIGSDVTTGGITLPIPGTGTEYKVNFGESVEWADSGINYKLESVGLTADEKYLLLNIYVDNKSETRSAKVSPLDEGSMLFYNDDKLVFSKTLSPSDMITAAKYYPENKYEVLPQTTGYIIVPLKNPNNISNCKFTIYPNITGSDDNITFSFSVADITKLSEPIKSNETETTNEPEITTESTEISEE